MCHFLARTAFKKTWNRSSNWKIFQEGKECREIIVIARYDLKKSKELVGTHVIFFFKLLANICLAIKRHPHLPRNFSMLFFVGISDHGLISCVSEIWPKKLVIFIGCAVCVCVRTYNIWLSPEGKVRKRWFRSCIVSDCYLFVKTMVGICFKK